MHDNMARHGSSARRSITEQQKQFPVQNTGAPRADIFHQRLENFINGKRRLILDGKLYRQRKSDSFIMKLFLLLETLPGRFPPHKNQC